VVAGVAFALPGITRTTEPARWCFVLFFCVFLVAAGGVAALLSLIRPPRDTRVLRRGALVVGAVAFVLVLVVGALGAGSAWRSFTSSAQVSNTAGRFGSASSNYRWVWWKQAWRAFEHHVLAGTGAGSFQLTNLRFRTSYLDVTLEPHSLPLQLLSETGIVGLVLFIASALALLVRGHGRKGPELALALIFPAYLLHALVDVDWDFAAVSVPPFLAAGGLAGRAVPARRASRRAALAFAGAALLAFGSLILPWLGNRWTGDAEALTLTSPPRAVQLARRARSVDPLNPEAVWAQALATSGYSAQQALYALATRKEPENPQWWLLKAEFELGHGCARAALVDFYRFNALDPYANPNAGPDDYRRALVLVNSGNLGVEGSESRRVRSGSKEGSDSSGFGYRSKSGLHDEAGDSQPAGSRGSGVRRPGNDRDGAHGGGGDVASGDRLGRDRRRDPESSGKDRRACRPHRARARRDQLHLSRSASAALELLSGEHGRLRVGARARCDACAREPEQQDREARLPHHR
jgi:hypothetical protein